MPGGVMFGVAMETGLKTLLSPESAAASDIFDQFANAQTFKSVQGTFRLLCDCLHIKPTNFPNFYPKIRAKLRSWKAQGLWSKFDKRVNHKCYNRGKVCANTKVLVIGAGPCGLRTAIEAQLSGAKVVVIEKRDRFSRNNVLHLWPYVIHDLRNLGAKKFYGKFCAGAIDHISIRQLQCVLLKVALLLGVEVHENVAFDDLIEPPDDQSQEKIGWRASLSPSDHPVSQYEFDVLIGADGKRNTVKGFNRKEFRGKLAIAITANFINRHSEAEARVQEISGIAFIFNQKFFQDLRDQTGIDLENIVYYKDETHYFVMTAKKHSLIEKGVIINDYADTARLLSPDNVNREALLDYAREAADFSTNCQMPNLDFAVNHYGQSDVAMFDFTSMFQAKSACRVIERRGHKLLQALVGDSLLEPFWPTGSGCARGFLSSLDACWMIRNWSLGTMTPLQVLAERESVYRLLAQTVPENLSKDYNEHTMNPSSRYRDLNLKLVRPAQVRALYDTDGEIKDEPLEIIDLPKKKRKRDSVIHPDTLLNWCQRQLTPYNNISVENMTTSWQNGLALCAIIHRYRPDLLDFHALSVDEAAANNQLAFDVCEREYSILPVMSGQEMADSDQPDVLAVVSYVTQIYETFRGEIPHVARAPMTDLSPDDRPTSPSRKSPVGRLSLLARLGQRLATKKRFSLERERERDRKLGALLELDGEKDATERLRRIKKRRSLERDRALFILNSDSAQPTLTSFKSAGPSLENRENFSSRVKDLEQKLYGTEPRSTAETTPTSAHKVGRIGRGDWNVKMLEERLKGIKPEKKEKEHVPKWNKDTFEDKKRTMDQKLKRESPDEPAKFINFDSSLTMLEKKLKDGNNLEIGLRGSNKVSAISAALESRPQTLPLQRSNSKPCTINTQNASEKCHFCDKRVYLMEQLSAQGKFFHRGCFKCECCGITLRLSNYGVGTEGPYLGHFLCMHHFNSKLLTRKRSTNDVDSAPKAKLSSPSSVLPRTPNMLLNVTQSALEKSRGMTPERAEFENTLDVTSEEELFSEIDEDEWTDRNFGMSANEYESSEEESDLSSDEISEEELEAAIQKPLTADQTWKLAANWKKRYSQRSRGDAVDAESDEDDVEEEGSDDEEGEYGGSSEDEYSYEEYENEDDESTATEGEAGSGVELKESEETPVEDNIQLPVPAQPVVAEVPNVELDYQVLKSNDLTGSEGDAGSDASEDSDDYTDDTETESDEDDDYAEEGADGDADNEADEKAAAGTRKHRRRHHSIPTIVIDESIGCAPNEDDDAYFDTLREQSRQAERTIFDLIHEQPSDDVTSEHSVAPTPETPLTPAFGVLEEMRPLVATDFTGIVGAAHLVSPTGSEPQTPIVRTEELRDVTIQSSPSDESSLDLSRTLEDPDIMGPLLDVAFIAESTLSDDGDIDDVSPDLTQPETIGKVVPDVVTMPALEESSTAVSTAPLVTQLPALPTLPIEHITTAPSEVIAAVIEPVMEVKPIPYLPAIRLEPIDRARNFGSDSDVVAVTAKPIVTVPDHISSRLMEELPLVTVARIAFDKRASQELSSSLPDLARTKEGSGGTSPVAGATIGGATVTEIPTVKSKMLKLKEQYLLGSHSAAMPAILPLSTSESGGSGSVPSTLRRTPHDSTSATTPKLEPCVRSLLDLISEKQKMLSPAPSPSPTATLQRPHGFTFGEVSPSSVSLASVLSSSSEPSAGGAHVGGSSPSSWSRISNVSPLVGSLSSSPTAFTVGELPSRTSDSRSPPPAETEPVVADDAMSVTLPRACVVKDVVPPPALAEISCGHVADVVLDVVIAAECPSSPACSPDVCVLTSTSSADSHPPEACSPTTNCDPIVNDVVVFSKTPPSSPQQQTKPEYEKEAHPLSLSPSLISPSIVNINIDAVTENHVMPPGSAEANSLADSNSDIEPAAADDATILDVDETFITFRDDSKRKCLTPSTVAVDTFSNHSFDSTDREKNKIEVCHEKSPTVVAVARIIHTYAGREPKQSYRDKFQKLGLFRFSGDAKSVAAGDVLRLGTATSADLKLDLLNENDIRGTSDEQQNNDCEIEQFATDNCQFSAVPAKSGADSESNVNPRIDDCMKGVQGEETDDDDDGDDSLGMLSNAESSDSDVTPNLDESIYSTPAAELQQHKSLPVKHQAGGGVASYVGHFADRSFPFGGVRDSIDIRKSALKRVPSYPTQPFRQAELTSMANMAAAAASDGNANFNSNSLLPENEKVDQTEPNVSSNVTAKEGERKFPSIEDLDAIPFVDDESSSNSDRGGSAPKNERFFTPRTSYKRPLQRPLSMVETRSTYSPFPSPIRRFLPDTPLTSPQQMLHTPRQTYDEAIDDLRQLRQTCTVERERARQEARERARLKSDEELGLSIVDYTNLRRKYQKPELRHSLSLEEERSYGRSPRDDGQESLYLPVELEMWANEGTSSDDEVRVDDRSSVPTSTTANTSEALRDASSEVYSESRPRLETQSQESSSPDSDVFEVFSPVTSPVPSATLALPTSVVDHAVSATTTLPQPVMVTDESSPEQPPSVGPTDSSITPGSSSDGNAVVNSASSPTSDSVTASAISKSDFAAYLEPSVISVDELNLNLSPDGCLANKNLLCPAIVDGKTKSSSLPGLILRKDKSKVPASPIAVNAATIKPKERKSLLSILTSFAKSDPAKSKTKDKEEKSRDKKKEKSPGPSSPLASTSSESAPSSLSTSLEARPLKVDGTPKESRFPKLRLARSKEKAKEKRKQKHLAASPNGGGEAGGAMAAFPSTTSSMPIPCATMPPRVTTLAASDSFRPQSYPSVNRRLDLVFDRNALIASMASISRKIPPSPKLLDSQVAPQASEDSFSDTEDDRTEELSQASAYSSGKKMKDIADERKRKLQKMAQRVYRQQEQKRLRTAQEIHRQLEELETNQKELEARGVSVEKALRGEGDVEDVRKEEAELMQEWFRLVHAKNLLVRQEQDIMVKAKELELEDRHSRLQHQLSQRMAIDDMKKSPEEMEEEGRILAELLEIVEQRDTLISLLEENRQRHQEEDEDLELNLQAKGLRLSPVSPNSPGTS